MPYWKLHYHLIWATFARRASIDAERERIIEATVWAKAKELSVVVHAIGTVEDHIHLVASIPPVRSVAECVKRIKGASSRAMNVREAANLFRWQEGYGALTIGARSLPTVIAYVRNQKQHHREADTIPVYETTESQ